MSSATMEKPTSESNKVIPLRAAFDGRRSLDLENTISDDGISELSNAIYNLKLIGDVFESTTIATLRLENKELSDKILVLTHTITESQKRSDFMHTRLLTSIPSYALKFIVANLTLFFIGLCVSIVQFITGNVFIDPFICLFIAFGALGLFFTGIGSIYDWRQKNDTL